MLSVAGGRQAYGELKQADARRNVALAGRPFSGLLLDRASSRSAMPLPPASTSWYASREEAAMRSSPFATTSWRAAAFVTSLPSWSGREGGAVHRAKPMVTRLCHQRAGRIGEGLRFRGHLTCVAARQVAVPLAQTYERRAPGEPDSATVGAIFAGNLRFSGENGRFCRKSAATITGAICMCLFSLRFLAGVTGVTGRYFSPVTLAIANRLFLLAFGRRYRRYRRYRQLRLRRIAFGSSSSRGLRPCAGDSTHLPVLSVKLRRDCSGYCGQARNMRPPFRHRPQHPRRPQMQNKR